MVIPLLTVQIRFEHDVVLARHRARLLASLLGYDNQEQVRFATAVSEIARNAYQYAGGGRAEFFVAEGTPQSLGVTIRDTGPGIANLQTILDGKYQSPTGMGVGFIGAKRLVDEFHVETKPGATAVTLAKKFPARTKPLLRGDTSRLVDQVAQQVPQNPYEEMQRQNQELVRALEEVQKRGDELTKLNRELEETNRGVVALYAELDQRADYLRRTSDLKTNFLSNMTHELRTPINSILGLSRMLLERLDGPLTPGQEQQVKFIRKGGEDLSELVNDLLDLAKVEAGKMTVRPAVFSAKELFGVLRGMLRPLLAANSALTLVFEDPEGLPALNHDESKVSQILRNFISNAIKYTPRGEVRVTARAEGADRIAFSVADTGIGIAPEDRERIFEEFAQVEGVQPKNVKGTGLGLPLSRKLAELLGGQVFVESTLGLGSTFTLVVPVRYQGAREELLFREASVTPMSPGRALIIDDDEISRYVLKDLLAALAYQTSEAVGGRQGIELAQLQRPDVIFLDLSMPEMRGEEVLEALRSNPATAAIPVVIHSSQSVDEHQREALLRHARAILSKDHADRERSISLLQRVLSDVRSGGLGEVRHG